jgi:hypothetical protein
MKTRKPLSWVDAAKRYGLAAADQMFPEDEPVRPARKRLAAVQVNRPGGQGAHSGAQGRT